MTLSSHAISQNIKLVPKLLAFRTAKFRSVEATFGRFSYISYTNACKLNIRLASDSEQCYSCTTNAEESATAGSASGVLL